MDTPQNIDQIINLLVSISLMHCITREEKMKIITSIHGSNVGLTDCELNASCWILERELKLPVK